MPRDLRDLTDLHLQILSALWARKEATIAQIYAAISPRADVTPKTIATLLGRLARRKLVGRRTVGREGVYRALVTRREVLLSRVGGILASVFAAEESVGSAAVRSRDVRAGDSKRLIELLQRAERDVRET